MHWVAMYWVGPARIDWEMRDGVQFSNIGIPAIQIVVADAQFVRKPLDVNEACVQVLTSGPGEFLAQLGSQMYIAYDIASAIGIAVGMS